MQKTTIRNRDGLDIVVAVEPGSAKDKLVFIAHGLGGFKEQDHVQAFADAFKNDGYTVVRWDATNSIGESAGENEDATMTGYYADFEDVIVWAAEQSWYIEPFVVCGHSLGGYCAARYAEDHPEKVKAVAPISLVISGELSHEAHQVSFPDQYAEWKQSGIKIEESKSQPGTFKRLKWAHMEDRLRHDLMPGIGKLTMPALLIVGEHDEHTPVPHQKMFYESLPSKRKEMHIIKGSMHTFRGKKHLDEVRTIIADWLKKLG